jgi:hypothetical protein
MRDACCVGGGGEIRTRAPAVADHLHSKQRPLSARARLRLSWRNAGGFEPPWRSRAASLSKRAQSTSLAAFHDIHHSRPGILRQRTRVDLRELLLRARHAVHAALPTAASPALHRRRVAGDRLVAHNIHGVNRDAPVPWCRERASIPRRTRLQRAALPTELSRLCVLAPRRGFEPLASD